MDESQLIDKLQRIEALFAGAKTEGERAAAANARDRILDRLRQSEREDPPIEYQFTLTDRWSRSVFLALLRRYGIRPYRYPRQRRTSVMARVSKRFVDQTLWPEYTQISATLQHYLADVTERIVAQVLQADSAEAEIVEEARQLEFGQAGE